MQFIPIFAVSLVLCDQAFSKTTKPFNSAFKKNDSEGEVKKGESISADIKDHPHHVSIQNEPLTNYSRCGGSIVSQDWVITVMKCIGDKMVVYVGSNKIHGGTRHEVKRKEQYSEILLLELQTFITFGPSANSVEITFISRRFTGTNKATVTGYGRFTEDGDYVDTLRKNEMSITANLKCDHTFSAGDKPLSKCTYNEEETNACKGDLGAGVVSNGILIGVAIPANGCIDLRDEGYYISIIPIALDILQTMAIPPEQG